MQGFRSESIFVEYLSSRQIDPLQQFTAESRFTFSNESRLEYPKQMAKIEEALSRLATHLRTEEPRLISQVRTLVDAIRPPLMAQTPKEQFDVLLPLQETLFWLPVTLLSHRRGDMPTLLLLSYLYATALYLEALFPDVAAPLMTFLAAVPLREIVAIIQTVTQQNASYDSFIQAASLLMDFPQTALQLYRSRREWAMSHQTPIGQQNSFGPDSYGLELMPQLVNPRNHTPNLSPSYIAGSVSENPALSNLPRAPFSNLPNSSIEMYNYKPFPPTYSYQNSPASTYLDLPIRSSNLRPEGESVEAGHHLPMPTYSDTRSKMGYGRIQSPPILSYNMSPNSDNYPSVANLASGCVEPMAMQT